MPPIQRTPIRKPVKRQRAEYYILLTLLSFAFSVSSIRLFLYLTGYPQIGNAELHIAHVLWGGLLLFIASLVPLLFANSWALNASAILSGLGVGLFIDEVGKFITQTNNYFYPAAAPIIYTFFLMTVLLYTQVRKRHSQDVRTEFYEVMEDLEEVLDHDLNEDERDDIARHLDTISSTHTSDIAELTDALIKFISSPNLVALPRKPNLWQRWQASIRSWSERWVKRSRLRAGLVGGLVALGIWSLFYPISIIYQTVSPGRLQYTINELFTQGLVRSSATVMWFELRLAFEFALGLLLVVAAVLLATRRQRQGVQLGYISLMLMLSTVDLLIFYFDQFSTIMNAALQFIVLLGLLYYRRRFLEQN
jgi:hypothetical protein